MSKEELKDLAVVWATQHGLVSTAGYELLCCCPLPLCLILSTMNRHQHWPHRHVCNPCYCTQVVGAGLKEKPLAIMHAPITVLPVVFPAGSFQKALAAMQLFNTLIDRVSRDAEYLQRVLAPAAEFDDFTVSNTAATRRCFVRVSCRKTAHCVESLHMRRIISLLSTGLC